MDDQKYIENNKLIAEFIGVQIIKEKSGIHDYEYFNVYDSKDSLISSTPTTMFGSENDTLNNINTRLFNPRYGKFKYNDSWDKLIPVLQKCWKTINMDEMYEHDDYAKDLYDKFIYLHPTDMKFETCYDLVVDTIKYINKIKINDYAE